MRYNMTIKVNLRILSYSDIYFLIFCLFQETSGILVCRNTVFITNLVSKRELGQSTCWCIRTDNGFLDLVYDRTPRNKHALIYYTFMLFYLLVLCGHLVFARILGIFTILFIVM